MYKIGDSIPFDFFFTVAPATKPGLSDVKIKALYKNGVSIAAVLDAVCTGVGNGVYRYVLDGATYVDANGDYVALAYTADATVDLTTLPCRVDVFPAYALASGVPCSDKTGFSLSGAGVSAVQSGLATSANQTTILARLGAFTATGVNTVLGFLQAIAQKAATLPSDIGGTFTPTTDSLEAIRDALTSNPAAVVTLVNGSTINIVQSDETTAAGTYIDLTEATTGYYAIDLIIKASPETDADVSAILWVRKTAAGTSEGLLYINGQTAVLAGLTAADASLTISTQRVGLNLSDNAAALLLKAPGLTYAVKKWSSATASKEQCRGTCNIVEAVERSVTL